VFEDSTFASCASRNPRRGWTAVVSFGLQAVVLGIAVLAPLLYTEALPVMTSYVEIPLPPGRRAAPAQPVHQASHPRPTEIREAILRQPTMIPVHINQSPDQPEPTPPGLDSGVIGVPPGGGGSRIFTDLLAATSHNAAPVAASIHPQRIRLSSINEGLLVHKVTPAYPKLAIAAHQQGSVILQATIGRDGTIENLHAISGPALLISAAIEAVKQWRYRPYLLNNQPVEVETQITVNFNLGG
jgi:protein TonB